MPTSPVVVQSAHLKAAEAALASEFPAVPADTIHALILCELLRYDRAKIREYIPLLVTSAIRNALRSPTLPAWPLLPRSLAP